MNYHALKNKSNQLICLLEAVQTAIQKARDQMVVLRRKERDNCVFNSLCIPCRTYFIINLLTTHTYHAMSI